MRSFLGFSFEVKNYALRDQPATAELCFPVSNDLICSVSLVGGKQALPEQTSASELSFGKCGRVSRSANGNDAGSSPGETRSTDFPKRKMEFAAASSAFAAESSAAPVITICVGWRANSVAASPYVAANIPNCGAIPAKASSVF